MTAHCKIIGVLDDGPKSLSDVALQAIKNAALIIGGHRTLDLFREEFNKQSETRDLTGKLTQVPQWIIEAIENKKTVVVLATGDPLCHGIASYLIKKIDHGHCEVIPNVSCIPLACAKVGLHWQDLTISSVHTKDAGEWQTYADPRHGLYSLLQDLKHHHKLAVFTSPENTPNRIARMMLLEGLEHKFNLAVVENLLNEQENVVQHLSVSTMAQQTYASPNILLLWAKADAIEKNLFGYADHEFHQRKPEKGLITKREVRAVSLARMQLRQDSIVWDIGAGSGSVGLEAATLCPKGHVYGIEKNEADLTLIEKNRIKMDLGNYSLFHGKAPDHLTQWLTPNAIFIGGSGGELAALIALSLTRLATDGWLIMNFVTFENLSDALSELKSSKATWDVTQLQVSRSQPILHMNRLAAENPVWIVSAQRHK